MTKSEIEAFLTVVQYGSISAAAEQLFVTQPALSRRIQNLESELEYKLFIRDKGLRRLSLTQQGKAFLSVAKKWDIVYEEAFSIRNMVNKPVLHLASVGSVSTYILPEIVHQFASKDSSYLLDYHSCHSWEGYSLIESGFADIALIDYIEQPNTSVQGSVLSAPAFSVPFVFIGGSAWKGKKILHPSDLDPQNEILLTWNTAFEIWHKYWFDVSLSPKVRLDFVSSIKDVLQDELFAIVPRTVAQHLATSNHDFVMCELHEGPPEEIIHCLLSVSSQQKPQVRFFFDLLKKELAKRTDVHCIIE